MKQLFAARSHFLLPFLLLLTTAARADAPAGTFTAAGQKGAITLTLTRANEEGEISGTLRGGTLNAKLEGEVENDVIEGIATGDDGTLLSGFRVRRDGAKVVLELVELTAEGAGPVKGRIVFAPGTAAPEPTANKPAKPAPAREPEAAGDAEDAADVPAAMDTD